MTFVCLPCWWWIDIRYFQFFQRALGIAVLKTGDLQLFHQFFGPGHFCFSFVFFLHLRAILSADTELLFTFLHWISKGFDISPYLWKEWCIFWNIYAGNGNNRWSVNLFFIHIEYLGFPRLSFQKQPFKKKGFLFTLLRLLFPLLIVHILELRLLDTPSWIT